ncbi:hypothetical protein F5050DRAFT_859536 [Lentinula boryana]|uniref:Secreted protein n=1 Tax=Lentinula boryana TaxID=40481 RepID=A0ABQ8QMQ4_9AGAR|nr:hypothetical protein F5050DRAFT_859536 [Lentinula boryana]
MVPKYFRFPQFFFFLQALLCCGVIFPRVYLLVHDWPSRSLYHLPNLCCSAVALKSKPVAAVHIVLQWLCFSRSQYPVIASSLLMTASTEEDILNQSSSQDNIICVEALFSPLPKHARYKDSWPFYRKASSPHLISTVHGGSR